MSQTLTISDRLYDYLAAEAKEQGLDSIERLLEVKYDPPTQLSEEELRRRQEAVSRIDEIRERIFQKCGVMSDSTELLRQDRER